MSTPTLPSTVNATLTDTHYYFYGFPSVFSNWYEGLPDQPCTAQFKDPLNGGLTFNSSEEAFMWWKAVFFGDHKIATIIETEHPSAKHVKALGRQIVGYDDDAWACVREGFMAYVLLLKFGQNPAFKAELMATGDRVIVEASPSDLVWGVGLTHNDPLILNEANWRGANLLGKALMTVRTILRAQAARAATTKGAS